MMHGETRRRNLQLSAKIWRTVKARIDSFKAQEAEEKERLREQELTVEMAESMRIQDLWRK